jgi:hypothetical protein
VDKIGGVIAITAWLTAWGIAFWYSFIRKAPAR